MTEREAQVIYSPSMVHQIEKTDPDFKKVKEFWEKAMGTKVQVEVIDGRLIVRPCSV